MTVTDIPRRFFLTPEHSRDIQGILEVLAQAVDTEETRKNLSTIKACNIKGLILRQISLKNKKKILDSLVLVKNKNFLDSLTK